MVCFSLLYKPRFLGAVLVAIALSACKDASEQKSVVQIFTPKAPSVLAQQNIESSTDIASRVFRTCGCADQSVTLPDGTIVAPASCKLEPGCGIGDLFYPPTYLHLKQSSSCYSVYGEYYVEAKTTAGADENGPGVPTESLSMAWRMNDAGHDKACGTGTFCAHSDRIYGFCATSLCSKAQMIIKGQKVTVAIEKDCKV